MLGQNIMLGMDRRWRILYRYSLLICFFWWYGFDLYGFLGLERMSVPAFTSVYAPFSDRGKGTGKCKGAEKFF
jgi:hypothetical protein